MSRFIFMLFGLIGMLCILTGCKTNETVSGQTELITSREITENLEDEDSFRKAGDLVSDMGVGWNLGNALDSFDGKKYKQEDLALKKSDYQMMAVYENKNWSAWDASSAIHVDNSGIVSITWDIDQLNSDLSGACGLFSFQMINNTNLDCGNDPIKFTVLQATFMTKGGTEIELSDMISEYEMTFKNGVTDYVKADLTKIDQLKTAQDILGGTLTIVVKVTEFPILQNQTSVQTPVEYYETLWGNPITTKEMIDTVAKAGFQSLRIPVTYYDHLDSEGIIDKAWLARVKEIVDYALADHMICIINVHHDTGAGSWIKADLDSIDTQKSNLASLWQQIAIYFKDYDDNLLFEGMNEILNSNNDWTNAGQNSYEAVNQLNQQFVNTVRNSGGNNVYRNLIINSYAASGSADVLNAFTIPKDSVQNHIIAEIHYYSQPSSEPDIMNRTFERLNNKFINQGIPVIIGEFASYSNISEEVSVSYITQFMKNAKERNIAVYWWDRGGSNVDSSNSSQTETLLDRTNLSWYSDKILKAVLSYYQ